MAHVVRYLDLMRTVPRLGMVCLAHYALHRVRLGTGAYVRSTPATAWEDIPEAWLAGAQGGFGNPSVEALGDLDFGFREELLNDAKRIGGGEFKYFSYRWLRRPADWRSNPFSGHSTPLEHWTATPDFDAEQGDVKWIWEPSRFDWAYTLGRAWVVSGDEGHAEVFWSLLEDWALHNPPNLGVNWKCGQECTLRMIALEWAAQTFDGAPASTPARKRLLWRIVAAMAIRIEPVIGYALSQVSNHTLSDALGLFVAGVSLPHHPRSQTWLRKGSHFFELHVLKQFEPDGSYCQDSMNYHRLVLKLGVIYVLLCKRAGRPPSDSVVGRLKGAAGFLRNMMDDGTGWLPNYGANDGANLMALSNCDYRDFRPILQLATIVLEGRRIFDKGPWDEEAVWLCGEHIYDYPLEVSTGEPMRATSGGYYCIRQEQDLAFIRCHTFKKRPLGHADMLHLDLWRDGVNLLCDSGTYQYYDPERDWGTHFTSTAAHNAIVVDGQDQMSSLGTFLWGSWTRSRVLMTGEPGRETGLTGLCFVGEHDGYLRRFGIRHRRSVLCRNGSWLIVDDAIYDRQESHDLTLAWHLDAAWECNEPSGHFRHPITGTNLSVYAEGAERAALSHEEHYPESARSLYYGDLAPITVYKVCKKTARSFRFITALTEDEEVAVESGVLLWHGLKIPVHYSPEPWI